MQSVAPHCPICRRMPAEGAVQRVGDRLRVSCATCGEFQISGTAEAIAAKKLADDSVATAKVSFGLRRMQEHAPWPVLDPDVLKRVIEDDLPSPREQADNLILWLGRNLRDSGPQSKVELDPDECAAIMGAVGFRGSMYVLTQLGDERLIDARPKGGHEGNPWDIGLQFKGWDRFYELERQVVESRVAFMAMQFGNDMIDAMFRECFKPAVAATGFEL